MTAEQTTEFRFRATADTEELGLFNREMRALEKRVNDASRSSKEWNQTLRNLGRSLIEDGRTLQQTSNNLRAVSSGLKALAQNATVGSQAFFSLSNAANRFALAAQPGTIGKLNVALAQQRQRLTELNLETAKGRVEFDRLKRSIAATERQLSRFNGARRGRFSGFGAGAGAIAAGGFFGGVEGTIGSIAGLALGGPAAALGGATIGAGVGRVRRQLGGFAEQAAELSRYQIALRETAGSQREYEQALEAITRANQRLNIPVAEGTRAFTKLSAAVIGAGGNIQDAELAFAAVNNAIKATGGSSRDVEGALLAVTQVFSKGKVSAEELRRQLGDRLPGAVNRFAESLGVSTKELDKLLREGQVGLGDFMKFLADLNTDFRGTAEDIAASSDDAGARLSAAWERSVLAIGDALKPLGAELQEGLIDVLDTLTPKIETLLEQLNENPERLKSAVDAVTESLKLAGDAAIRLSGLVGAMRGAATAVRDGGLLAVDFAVSEPLSRLLGGDTSTLRRRMGVRAGDIGDLLNNSAADFGTFFNGVDSGPPRGMDFDRRDDPLSPSGLITNDTDGADGSGRSSADREAERAARLQQRLANEQRRLAKEKAENERRLALEVFRYQQELDEQRYQNLRRLEDLRAANQIGALPQGQRRVAGILDGLRQSLAGLGGTARQDRLRVAAAQQGLSAAQSFEAGIGSAPVLPLGAGAPLGAGGGAFFGNTGNVRAAAGWGITDLSGPTRDAVMMTAAQIVANRAAKGHQTIVAGGGGLDIDVTNMAPAAMRQAFARGMDVHARRSPGRAGTFPLDLAGRLGTPLGIPLSDVGFWGGANGYGGVAANGVNVIHIARNSASGGGTPGGGVAGGAAITFQNDLMRAQAGTASAQAGLDQARAIQAANADARPAFTNEQVINASQQITQTYRDQAETLENSLEALQLRNRLTLEGASPQVIQQEEQLLELRRSANQELELLNKVLGDLRSRRGSASGQDLLDIEKQIAGLETAIPKINDNLDKSVEKIRRISEESERLEDPWAQLQLSSIQARKDLETLVNPATQIQAQAQAIGNSFGSAFESLITGSRSAKEAVADMFRGIAGSFANMAAQIAAKSVQSAIEGAAAGSQGPSGGGVLQSIVSGVLGGLGGGGGGNVPFLSGGIADAVPFVRSFVPSIFSDPPLVPRRYAEGGRPRVGEARWVGERGPELEVPFQAGQIISNKDVQDAIVSMARGEKIMRRPRLGGRGGDMAVPFRGSTGTLAVPFQRGGESGDMPSAANDAGDAIRFESVVINGQEFVTRSEAEQIGRRAANRGAALAQKQLRNNPANRKAVGID